MNECRVTIPLGNITMRLGDTGFDQLVEVLGQCETICLSTTRLTKKVLQIRIRRTNVLAARGSNLKEIDDTVSGLRGDTLRLTYGETITIESVSSSHVELKVVGQ